MALFKRDQTITPGKPATAGSIHQGQQLLLIPVVSEKSSRLKVLGQYTFAVRQGTSKVEVKKAIEALYNVRVLGVNSVNLPGKTVRRGRTSGRTKDRHHIIVRLSPGQSIDLGPKA